MLLCVCSLIKLVPNWYLAPHHDHHNHHHHHYHHRRRRRRRRRHHQSLNLAKKQVISYIHFF